MRIFPSRSRRRPARLAAFGLIIALWSAAVPAAPPSRIVAIGDIHGAYESFVEILQRTKLIDSSLEWIGGDALLVQTGDFVDKGPDVRKVMDLLVSLQIHAPDAGGQVLILMGNHEAMNVMGLIRDVNAETFREFVDEGSEKRRNKAYKAHVRLSRKRVRQFEMAPKTFDDAAEAAWMKEHPLGRIEYLAAMSETGAYGKWIRSLPVALRVGDLFFIHAGIGAESAALSADEINRLVEADIQKFDLTRADLIDRQVVLPSYSWKEMSQAIADEFHGYRDRGVRNNFLLAEERDTMLWLAEFLEFNGGNLTAGEGPLWFRGFARWTETEGAVNIDLLAAKHDVRSFISGHTPSTTPKIRTRFDGRIILIDTGMLKSVYNGSASALEIRDGRFRAIYPATEELLFERPAIAGDTAGQGAAPVD